MKMRRRALGIAFGVALVAALVPASALAHGGDEGGEEAELKGVIESLPGTTDFVGDWVVSGTTVHVTAETEIEQEDGAVAVGASVEVEGTPEADGSITAEKIEVEEGAEDDEFGEIEFEGVVQSLPASTDLVGDWVVSGLTVHVTTDTELEQESGAFAIGALVEVKGLLELDGSVTADEIEIEDESEFDEGSGSLSGVVQHRPKTGTVGAWRVSKQIVRVNEGTKILRHGHPLVRGADVRVVGIWRANGSIRATRIVVRG